MERLIIFPKSGNEEILVNQVEDVLNASGMILVYDEDGTNVGHVVCNSDLWILRTVDHGDEQDSLEALMVDNNQFTYKLIT